MHSAATDRQGKHDYAYHPAHRAHVVSAATDGARPGWAAGRDGDRSGSRSEEHTSELQSLMRISYAVFCLKKKNTNTIKKKYRTITTYNQLQLIENNAFITKHTSYEMQSEVSTEV